jgi:hypothetical protein
MGHLFSRVLNPQKGHPPQKDVDRGPEKKIGNLLKAEKHIVMA